MYEDVEIEEGGVSRLQSAIGRKWQHWLDLSAPHTAARWAISVVIMLIYCIRVYLINGGSRNTLVASSLLSCHPALCDGGLSM